jgi:hypothetical protein
MKKTYCGLTVYENNAYRVIDVTENIPVNPSGKRKCDFT